MLFNFFMLDNISGWELFIILFVVYLFFGVKAIPKLFHSFKKSWSHWQDAMHEIRKEMK
ncbi:MAG: twin-arginine translocase TatA/TatE family subunit [Cyclobacteriaceae bacterium]